MDTVVSTSVGFTRPVSITLRDILILSLGALRISFTYEEVKESFDLLSNELEYFLTFNPISNHVFHEFLDKMVRKDIITIQFEAMPSGNNVPTIKITETGIIEYELFVATCPQEVLDGIEKLKFSFGL